MNDQTQAIRIGWFFIAKLCEVRYLPNHLFHFGRHAGPQKMHNNLNGSLLFASLINFGVKITY